MNAQVSIDIDLSSGETAFADGLAALRRGPLQIPDHVDVVEWIEEHCMLSREVSAEPGPVSLYGYQKGLARLMADPLVQDLAVLKSARVGYTQIATFVVGYFVEHEAASVLVAQPTDDDARDFGKSQMDSLFRETTALTSLIRERNLGDALDTWSDRRYRNGATLRLRGAASDDAFRRYTCRITVGDEIDGDAWRNTSTNAQGNKMRLMWERSRTFWNRKRIVGSTPNVRESSLIYPEFLAGTQHRYFVPCPHCGEEQYLQWGGLKTPHGIKWSTDAAGRVTDAWYVCKHCEQRIDEGRKRWMDERGEFRATATPKRPGLVSVHVWAGMSLFPGAAWRVLAQEFLDAQGDPELLQPFVNLVLGEPWDALEGKTVKPEGLAARSKPFASECPDGVVVATCGIDVQSGSEDQEKVDAKPPRLEVQIVGHGRGGESWVLGYWVLDRHEPFTADSRAELDALLQRRFRKADGTEVPVTATAIDTGGGYGDAVKSYAASRTAWNVWAVKGRNNRLGTRSASVWPARVSRAKGSMAGFAHRMIDTQLAKDVLGRRLKIESAGPGFVHFPKSLPDSYFHSLAAEKLVVDKRGNRFWRKRGANTGEAWDTMVYAYAALCGHQASFKLFRDLNLAADRAGISKDPPHDPETGELEPDYAGPDRSAQSARVERIPDERKAQVTTIATPREVDRSKPVDEPKASAAQKPSPVEKRTKRVQRVPRTVTRSNWMSRR